MKGELTTENEVDRPMISSLKGIRLNMATLPREMLYLLQDGVTIELGLGRVALYR